MLTEYRASDISRKEKQNFAGFSGANSRENRPISRDFHGKTIKICGTIGQFHGRKVKIRRKNRPISRDLSGKKVNFRRIFRGKFLEKSADFTGNFGGKVRQGTISKKQPISLDFFSVTFAKIDQFCVDMTSVGESFF